MRTICSRVGCDAVAPANGVRAEGLDAGVDVGAAAVLTVFGRGGKLGGNTGCATAIMVL